MMAKSETGSQCFDSDNSSKLLPSLFKMEDYNDCIERGNVYCAADAKLEPKTSSSDIWHIIKALEDDQRYDKTILHRSFCVPQSLSDSEVTLKSYSDNIVNDEVMDLNLTASVDGVVCTDGRYSLNSFDIFILGSLTCYLVLVTLATTWHMTRKLTGKDFLAKFSMFYNWKELTKDNRNDDYVRLRCMQGIRIFCMIAVIIAHTKLSYLTLYVTNTERLEEMYYTWRHAFYLDVFIVQIFFMMSSWLLVVKVNDIIEKHGEFSFKRLCYLILNRYFRLAVTLAVYVGVFKTSLYFYLGKGASNLKLLHILETGCRTNWLPSLLFYNNFFYMTDICIPSTWYISADFQFYVLGAFAFYFILKYKLNLNLIVASLLVASMVAYGSIIYILDLGVIYRLTFRAFDQVAFFKSFRFKLSYLSTLSSLTTSYVGIVFGLIYCRTKHKTGFNSSKLTDTLLLMCFLGLPIMVMWISSREYGRITSAIVGPFMKPLFVLGVGLGILGTSRGVGGFVKKILESRIFEVIGNITYCTYLFHSTICFWKFHKNTPVEISYTKIIIDFITNVILSLALGLGATLTIELPGRHLQKVFLSSESDGKDRKKS